MRDKYWAMYTEIKHKERYYCKYLERSQRCNAILTVFCIFMSTTCIGQWFIWRSIPLTWAILFALSQVIQICQPHLPFSRQIVSLTFLVPVIQKLIFDIDYSWDLLDEKTDLEMAEQIYTFERQFNDCENQFLTGVYMPVTKRFDRSIEEECLAYFGHRYRVGKEVNFIE